MSPSSSAQLIEIQPRGGVGRWVQQRMSNYSQPKEAFVLLSTTVIALFGGPALIFYCMSSVLAGSAGTSGGGAAALAFNAVLSSLLWILTAILGICVFNIFRKPSYLSIDDLGLRYQYNTPIGALAGRLMPWHNIAAIEFKQIGRSINPDNRVLSIVPKTKGKPLDLRLAWLKNPESKEQLAAAFAKYLPELDQNPEITLYLKSGGDYSFTEIWFQSLDIAPNLPTLILSKSDAGDSASSSGETT
jgi:hypothetical protein